MQFYRNLSIRKKLIGGMSVIMLILIFQTLFMYSQQTIVNNSINEIHDESIFYLSLARDFQLSVIQVQQWLTDVSATRAAEGFDDGYDEARNYYEKGLSELEEFRKYFSASGNVVMVKAVEKIKKDFEEFYDTGFQMANSYVEFGPQKGNIWMEKFDPYAENIYNSVDELLSYQTEQLNSSIENTESATSSSKQVSLISLFLILIAMLIFSFSLINGISKPIDRLVEFAKKIGLGKFDNKLSVKYNDELGTLSRMLLKMQDALLKTKTEQTTIQSSVRSNVNGLIYSAADLEGVSKNIKISADNLFEQANMVSAATEELSINMSGISASSEESQANLNTVATATEEMTAAIGEVAQNTERARHITNTAVDNVRSASDKVDELGVAAGQISKVIETIVEIAEQTKLLALNATIEAARAGEAGKGFAVVANEVKELAKQTNDATIDIRSKVGAIQTSTHSTVSEMGNINKVIKEVNEIVNTIATAVEEQNVTTQDIAENISLANRGVDTVVQNVTQAAVATKEIAENITKVHGDSKEVVKSGEQLDKSTTEITSGISNVVKEVYSVKTTDIQWSPDLATGENFIDAQHIEIYVKTDILVKGAKEGMSNSELKKNLDFLAEYVTWHFGKEEEYMQNINYPEYDSHKIQHTNFLETVGQLSGRFNQNGDNTELVNELADIVVKWLNTHIKKIDTKLAAYLK